MTNVTYAQELPKSVVVTNVDLSVFDDPLTKTSFETMFREYDCGANFHYLRCIRRIRVDFESHLTASMAKQKLDNTLIANNVIHCYFIQVYHFQSTQPHFMLKDCNLLTKGRRVMA